MKNKLNLRSLTVIAGIFMFTLFLSSCVKGPEGEQGPQGEAGNANVTTYSITADLSLFQVINTTGEYRTTIDLSSLNIGSTDAVLVYYDRETINNEDYWAQLPFDDWLSASQYNHYSFEIGTNSVLLVNIRNSNNDQPFASMTGNIYFKAVVIRGYAGKKAVIPAALNTNNYSDVKNYYKLAN